MIDYTKIARAEGMFILTSLSYEDLEGIFTEKEIKSLDEGDMINIAHKMANAYIENGYWDDLKIIAQDILDDKNNKN